MARKVTIDTLGAAISDILKEYQEDSVTSLQDVTKKVAQKGAQAIKSSASSTFGGTGKYARSWKVDVENTRLGASAVIHSTVPGLPHLLEHGHANRDGGRTAGRTHIAPVEQEINNTFLHEVEVKL